MLERNRTGKTYSILVNLFDQLILMIMNKF